MPWPENAEGRRAEPRWRVREGRAARCRLCEPARPPKTLTKVGVLERILDEARPTQVGRGHALIASCVPLQTRLKRRTDQRNFLCRRSTGETIGRGRWREPR